MATAIEQDSDTRRDRRRRAILAAAHELFLEQGYAATTLGDVVARSGGSLATLYALFSNKQGLLRAIVEERCSDISAAIEGETLAGRPPADALRGIAKQMLNRTVDDDGVALFRVIVGETLHSPELGRLFYEAGPATGRARLADYLARQHERGALVVDDPQAAAAMFLQMLAGERQMQMLCGLPGDACADARRRHLDYVIGAFIRLHAPPTTSP